jgi:hypothetical protein
VFKRRSQRPDGQKRTRGDRRRVSRQTAGWASDYAIVNGSQEVMFLSACDYTPCVLQDLSIKGAGLELPAGDVAIGDRVVLKVPLGERQRATIRLTGEIRHATPDSGGSAMAGVEFVDVGDLERALLLRLLRDMETRAHQNA